MNLKTHDYKTKLLLLLLITIAISISAVILFEVDLRIAYATDSINSTSTRGQYDAYTDSDNFIFNDAEYSIRNYGLIANTTVSVDYLDGAALNVTGDDAIVKIIPKELFKTVGDHTYVGKEYGFFIHTVDDPVTPVNRQSTVVIFDITYRNLALDDSGIFEVEVMPIIQDKFVFISSSANTFSIKNNSHYSNVKYSISDPDGYVVPGADSFNGIINFDVEVCEYYLKDISYNMTLFNEQELNDGMPGYRPENDLGSYFTYYDYKYDGTVRERGDFPIKETIALGIDCIDVGLSVGAAVLKQIPIVGNVLNAVSDIIDIGSKIGDVVTFAGGMKNYMNPKDVNVNNGVITATNYAANRDEQIARYGGLMKSAGTLINTSDVSSIWYKNGDKATGYYKVTHAALNGQQVWNTRMSSNISILVVDTGGNKVGKAKGIYDHPLRTPVYKEVAIEDAQELYLLDKGINYLEFNPVYESDYEMIFGTGQKIEVYVDGTKIIGFDNIFTVKLSAGKHHIIIQTPDDGCVSDFIISPNSRLTDISVTSGSEYLLKYDYNQASDMKCLTNTSDLKFEGVYQKTENGFSLLSMLADYNADTTIYSSFIKGQTYYIVIKNSTDAIQSTDVNASIIADNIAETTSSTLSLYPNSNYKFFKFNGSNSTVSDYQFYFSGLLNETDAMYFTVYNSLGQEKSRQPLSYGYLKVNSVKPQEKLYIGVLLESSRSAMCNFTSLVSVSEFSYIWKIYKNNILIHNSSETKVKLQRNTNYRVELWLNDIKKVNMLQSVNATQSVRLNAVNGTLSISNALISESFSIQGLKKADDPINSTLQIKIIYNPADFVTRVNYTDSMDIYWTHDNQLQTINYTVSGDKEGGGAFSESGVWNFGNSGHIGDSKCNKCKISLLSILIKYRAVSANLTIHNIKVNGQVTDTGHLENIVINRSVSLNCKYTKTTTSGWIFKRTYYYIANALQLYNIRNTNLEGRYYLENDIDLSGFGNWSVIPNFYGIFNGENYTVSNLKIQLPAGTLSPFDGENMNDYSIVSSHSFGLFGLNRGTITDLKVTKFLISSAVQHSGGWAHIGIIAGTNFGTITNCVVTVGQNLTTTDKRAVEINRNMSRTGGIAGDNSGTINNCTVGSVNDSQMVFYSNGDCGGIAGRNSDLIANCIVDHFKLQLYTVYNNRSVGGIIGYCIGGTVHDVNLKNSIIDDVNHGSISFAQPSMGYIVGGMLNTKYYNWFIYNVDYHFYSLSHSQCDHSFKILNKKLGYDGQGNAWQSDLGTN